MWGQHTKTDVTAVILENKQKIQVEDYIDTSSRHRISIWFCTSRKTVWINEKEKLLWIDHQYDQMTICANKTIDWQ